MTNVNPWNIRKLADNDFEDFARIVKSAYPALFPDNFTSEDQQEWIERMKCYNKDINDINYYGYFQNGKLLGGMAFFDFMMNFHGIKSKVGGVGLVCVDLLHRKEHIGKKMIQFFHEHYYNRDFPLTALYPFFSGFYKKMGYGIGTKYNQYSFKPKNLPKKSTKNHLLFLNEEHLSPLTQFFNKYVDKTHGMIYRNEKSFNRLLNSYKILG
ncbi:MAG: GNAT family N-acetyltransferase, partial [Candidatus Hodarchaeales archaeon]